MVRSFMKLSKFKLVWGAQFFISVLILFILSCSAPVEKIEVVKEIIIHDKDTLKSEIANRSKIKLGIDVLTENNFDILKGKNVGLITNQTGVNNQLIPTLDILFQSQEVNLIALFGPEHGVRGDVEGGKYIEFYYDSKTNLPVYSLYGKTRKPTKEMLRNIDVLIYDIQDIGVRSYTFISTMGLAMEAAAENNIEFIVLDRPNPLGGLKVEGNITEKEFTSFISQFPIPYVYGLTCGELAQMLLGESMLDLKNSLNLKVVQMKGWNRKMNFQDTGLEWIPTSPHIPHNFSAYFYPMTGILGELRSSLSIGVGYTLPFQIVGAEWINSIDLANELNAFKIEGVHFRPITFKPYYAFGVGKTLNGIQIHITDYKKLNLTNTQFYIIYALKKLYPQKNLFELADSAEIVMFNKAAGTDKIKSMILDEIELNEVIDFLDKDVENFKELSKKYFLYGE